MLTGLLILEFLLVLIGLGAFGLLSLLCSLNALLNAVFRRAIFCSASAWIRPVIFNFILWQPCSWRVWQLFYNNEKALVISWSKLLHSWWVKNVMWGNFTKKQSKEWNYGALFLPNSVKYIPLECFKIFWKKDTALIIMRLVHLTKSRWPKIG